MPNIAAIVEHTPLWVFALLALLVFFGVQALRPRKPRMLRLLIVPAVFITWGVTSLLARSAYRRYCSSTGLPPRYWALRSAG
jgi:hypothetical protein